MRLFNLRRDVAAIVNDISYQQRVAKRLKQVLADVRKQDAVIRVDHSTARYIIFSDLHRGIRNQADDHRQCERAFNAALAYYYGMGHTLIILGDAEELWEESARDIIEAYEHSLSLEARFHQEGRYIRIWGNHDDEWNQDSSVRNLLDPIYEGAPLNVRESLLLEILDGSDKLGEFFLIHGHQGTLGSDTYGKLARWLVRKIWRRVQNFFGITANTVAKDWKLRAKHDVAMFRWAEQQSKLALIAGHTHRPVFKSKSHAAKIQAELESKVAEFEAAPDKAELREEVALLMAELEWVRAQEADIDSGPEGTVVDMDTPCYFNTGCCCFPDGDVTGIEIADDMIRLVRFPFDEDQPKPCVLEQNSIRGIFADIPS